MNIERHECEEHELRKLYVVHSPTTIRRIGRKDGGGWRLELRENEGDFDSLDIGVAYCPFCGVKLERT